MTEHARLFRTRRRLEWMALAVGVLLWPTLGVPLGMIFRGNNNVDFAVAVAAAVLAAWLARQLFFYLMRRAGFVYCRDVPHRDPNSYIGMAYTKKAWLPQADAKALARHRHP